MKLYIGNKNYSSWSLRAWLLMSHAGIEFEEVALRLHLEPGSPFREVLAAAAPDAPVRVPLLVDGDLAVWDSLAIAEYLAERFPERGLWPADTAARARARSLCAEMHAGFLALRQHCPMNIEAVLVDVGPRLVRELLALRADLARLQAVWTPPLEAHGGPFLFGRFSIADAYFAPVCSRIRTYGLPVPERLAAYVGTVLDLPALRQWSAGALAEHDFLAEDEPYRQQA